MNSPDTVALTDRRAEHAHHDSHDRLRSFPPEASLGSRCDACRFRGNCIGHAFRSSSNAMQPLVGYRRHLAAGEVLYHAGAKCSLLHVAQAGFFKTIALAEDGTAQITGFQMPGDVLGMDGLGGGVHRCEAVALTDASVCVVSRARLLQAALDNERLCRHLLTAMNDEILADHGTMLLLGSRSAEERVAGFLLGLSERLAARGYPRSEIGLWMSREEIGCFLGLELETVSRALSSLLKRRLIEVDRRRIAIPDIEALHAVVAGHELRPQRGRHAREREEAEIDA